MATLHSKHICPRICLWSWQQWCLLTYFLNRNKSVIKQIFFWGFIVPCFFFYLVLFFIKFFKIPSVYQCFFKCLFYLFKMISPSFWQSSLAFKDIWSHGTLRCFCFLIHKSDINFPLAPNLSTVSLPMNVHTFSFSFICLCSIRQMRKSVFCFLWLLCLLGKLQQQQK